jgi:hypothetical protein
MRKRFATDESLKEIHRVLRPAAAFGVIWNIEDCPSLLYQVGWKELLTFHPDNAPKEYPSTTRWEQKLKDIIASLDDGHPRFRHMTWKQVFEEHQNSALLQVLNDTLTGHMPMFSLPLGEENVKWTVWLTDTAVWSRYATLSMIANLGEDRKEEIRKEVFDALKDDGVERNARGEIAVHGMTYFAWTSRV